MKRLVWLVVLALAAGLAVSCASIKAKKGEKPVKAEKKTEAKAEKAEKKAEAKAKKVEKQAEAKVEKAASESETKAEEAQKQAEAAVELEKVDSSLIDAVGYDPATQDLTIVFVKTGETYVYHKVPKKVYKKLMAADSKGKFFTENIKGKYEFTKK